jgi:hypothetical protein
MLKKNNSKHQLISTSPDEAYSRRERITFKKNIQDQEAQINTMKYLHQDISSNHEQLLKDQSEEISLVDGIFGQFESPIKSEHSIIKTHHERFDDIDKYRINYDPNYSTLKTECEDKIHSKYIKQLGITDTEEDVVSKKEIKKLQLKNTDPKISNHIIRQNEINSHMIRSFASLIKDDKLNSKIRNSGFGLFF